MNPLREKARMAGLFLLWSALGALIVAAFFITAFFGDFSPLRLGDSGAVILFVPVLTAFTLGLLLTDYELLSAVMAALLTTGIAVGLIVAFMAGPLLAGVAGEGSQFQEWVVQRVGLSAVLLFPLILLGTVVGRAVGERILPPEEVRTRREALMAETRAWHEQLSRMERTATRPGEEKRP
ncbi:MAG: hypothetical protein A3K65_05025 [Euryarchaeota archaeon RBG_16_68_12]|nr:MAG: hypothetical protein A3K65_05025 [Euryarchaeota archaeon RBG_16_68_12]